VIEGRDIGREMKGKRQREMTEGKRQRGREERGREWEWER
jgi:hypothetical protein